MIILEIPTDWSKRLLQYLNANQLYCFHIYGCLSGIYPTGRPDDIIKIDKQDLVEHYHYASSSGILTNYLLNGIASASFNYKNNSRFSRFMNWLLSEVKPKVLTVSSSEMINWINSKYNFNSFCISTIAGLDSINSIKRYLKKLNKNIYVDSIVLSHNCTKVKFTELLNINSFCLDNNIRATLLLTESCYSSCTLRSHHYKLVGVFNKAENYIDYYQIYCVLKRLLEPTSLLDLVGHILPCRIVEYVNHTGIHSFKISGRSCSSEWLFNTLNIYLHNKAYVNIFDAVVFTTPFLKSVFNKNMNQLFYIDYGAFKSLNTETLCLNNINYMQKKACELFSNGALVITDDDSKYEIINDKLICTKRGIYCNYLIDVLKRDQEYYSKFQKYLPALNNSTE